MTENGGQHGYVIRSKQSIEQGGEHRPVEIIIASPGSGQATGSQQLVLERLEQASQNLEARWFAYGVMRRESDGFYRLIVEHLDHVYLHRLEKTAA
jgi:hypothetical protein